jgi:hypothetical protein
MEGSGKLRTLKPVKFHIAHPTPPNLLLLRLETLRLLANLVPNFFPAHGNFSRRGKAQPDDVAFDRDDGDRQVAVREYILAGTGIARVRPRRPGSHRSRYRDRAAASPESFSAAFRCDAAPCGRRGFVAVGGQGIAWERRPGSYTCPSLSAEPEALGPSRHQT